MRLRTGERTSLSDSGFGERDSKMVVLAHVVVVEVNEALNCLFNGGHLQKRHFVILEKFEGFHRATRVGEQNSKVILGNVFRDIGQMQGGRGWEDVLEVLGAGLLEAM